MCCSLIGMLSASKLVGRSLRDLGSVKKRFPGEENANNCRKKATSWDALRLSSRPGGSESAGDHSINRLAIFLDSQRGALSRCAVCGVLMF